MKEDQTKKKAEDLVDKIKELVKKGEVSRIIIRKNGETVVNLPVNVGILGIALAPWAMLVATLVTLGTDCEITVEKKDKTYVDITEDGYEVYNTAEHEKENKEDK